VLRLKVPNTGAMVELSSKFGASPGEAVDLILEADGGPDRRGHQLPRRQPDDEFRELRPGHQLCREHLQGGADRGYTKMNLLDIGGGFPAPYDATSSRSASWPRSSTASSTGSFPRTSRSSPSRAASWCATAGTAVSKIIGKAVRDGKPATTSTTASITPSPASSSTTAITTSRRSRSGPTQICSVFGPTCDALDVVSMAENLPRPRTGRLLYSENIGAYSHASSTYFNGFPPATVVHLNRLQLAVVTAADNTLQAVQLCDHRGKQLELTGTEAQILKNSSRRSARATPTCSKATIFFARR
jgi:ornithine decarboxylase